MVKPDKANAKDLFEKKRRYDIPPFQRPYVWNEEDQWAPLWEDVVRVSEGHIVPDHPRPVTAHFMGAVVVEWTEGSSTGVERYDVIDGQQRLTTLQLLIDAVQKVLVELGHEDEADALRELTLNDKPKFANTPERFKLWPSQADRAAFAYAMDRSGPAPQTGSRIADAHSFFAAEAHRWLTGKPDEHGDVPPGNRETRAAELCETLNRRLMVVTIDLSDEDDPQLIFETLNDRGTPLLRADLIKNWIFREGKKLGADVDRWAATVWDDFDGEWWRQEIAQGRLSRSRVDIFLQYWLTMRTMDEVKSERVFLLFTEYAREKMSSVESAEAFLQELRADADTYRNLADLDATSSAGRFHRQVIEAMELAATMPVFLWFISRNHAVPTDQIDVGLEALESWATRRTLLRLTGKDVNRFMVAILKDLDGVNPAEAGKTVRDFLSRQTAESRRWPSDDDLKAKLPITKVYGLMKQSRICAVLDRVEQRRRSLSTMHELVPIPSGLSLEHIMPRSWRTYWDEKPSLDQKASERRDVLVNSLGNLTVITQSLNSSLSHRPWTDGAAEGMKQGGYEGEGKRSLLQKFSLLLLNKMIVDEHPDSWREADIATRGAHLTEDICAIWPGPVESIQAAAVESAREQDGKQA